MRLIQSFAQRIRWYRAQALATWRHWRRNRRDDPPAAAMALLASLGADRTEHLQKRSLGRHLYGTYGLLKRWQEPQSVCLAGLFHSVYGTFNFRTEVLPLTRRAELGAVIGPEAERLVYLYSCEDREHFRGNLDRAASPWLLRDWRSGIEETLTDREFGQLLTLRLADHLEQLPFNGDGRHAAYYQRFAPYLASAPQRALQDAFSRQRRR